MWKTLNSPLIEEINVQKKTKSRLTDFVQIMKKILQLIDNNVFEIIEEVITLTNIIQKLKEDPTDENINRINNIGELVNSMKMFAGRKKNNTLLDFINDQSIISAIFSVAGFTYGPLLGLYFFGLFTSYKVHDKFVPYVAIIAPILSYFIQKNFSIGFEILLINGLIVCFGLLLIKKDNVSLTKS